MTHNKKIGSRLKKWLSVIGYRLSVAKWRERGFSLLELVVVVGIIGIISAVAASSYYSLISHADLSGSTKDIIGIIDFARSQTVSSRQASPWGVHFETNKYALFKGPIYSALGPNTKIYNLSSSLEISAINLTGGGPDALFTRITGQTVNYGSITVRKKNQPANLINITIENSGQASATTLNQPPAGTRITDSRHIHFTYNGNSQTAITLLLSFSAFPASNISIPFQNFLNPAKDSFLWEQTVTVNGISRIIRINSHLLNSSLTDFSVQRERENNAEAMSLTLDGQNLLNYTAGGQESQGSSAWVSAPERQ